MKKIIITAIIGALIGIAAVLAVGQMATKATPSAVGPLAANEQEITLTTTDGVPIAASFFPAADQSVPVILMLHGNGANRAQFQGHIGWLNQAGYAVMTLDFRGHGESAAKGKSFGLFEARDGEAAVAWLRQNHPQSKIGVIGVSLGGAAALLGDDGPLQVDAMVLKAVYPDIDRAIRNRAASRLGPFLAGIATPLLTYQSPFLYGEWPDRISPIAAARFYTKPALVIGGAGDIYTPQEETIALADAFGGQSEVWIVPELSHDQLSDFDNAEYQARVLGFFGQAFTR
jgi:uncharacterized protein